MLSTEFFAAARSLGDAGCGPQAGVKRASAFAVRQMAVVLTANASADNTCNCYEPPAAPKLLTIAKLSNIAFIGHACASLFIFVNLGFAIFLFVLFSGTTGPEDSETQMDNSIFIVEFLILGLIVVSRVATTATGRTV